MNNTNPSSDWNDSEWNEFGEWLRGMLRSETVTVTFTKSDGTERVMRCTLQPSVLPPVTVKEGATRKSSTSSIAVWDLDVAGWRSFTLRSVRSVQLELGA